MKKVLYSEILFNIKILYLIQILLFTMNLGIVMGRWWQWILKQTDNVDLIEDWISSIEDVYDLQNGNNKELII